MRQATEERKIKRRAYERARLPLLAKKAQVRRDKDRQAYNEYMKAWRRDHVEARLFQEARCRAKRSGIAFDLIIEDVVVPKVCPVFGTPLIVGNGGGPQDASPTLDRIITHLGYVRGNVWVISAKANRCKNNATLEELKILVCALEKMQQKA